MAKMSKKPLNPRLPGRLGKMTAGEMDDLAARYDGPIADAELRPLTAAQRAAHAKARRKAGRPVVAAGAEKIHISVERGLLARVDAAAARQKTSRSRLIAEALHALLA